MKIKKTRHDYIRCYIAYLDILGFKNIVKTTSFHEVFEILARIRIDEEDLPIAFTRAANEDDWELNRYNAALKETKIRIMSDSIVIAAPAERKESLAVVIDLTYQLQTALYELETPVFLRGAITIGDIYVRDEMMFGQGLIEAYLAQEELAVYPRVIISENVLMSGVPGVDDGFHRFQTFPEDADGYYHIDMLSEWLLEANCGIPVLEGSKYETMKRHVDGVLAGYTESRSVRDKYLWLREDLARAVQTAEAWRTGTICS